MKLTICTGRVEDVLPRLEPGTFDACLCDPPYGLGFMGKAWDTFSPGDSPMRRRAETDAVNAGVTRQGGRQRACADFQRRQLREMHTFQAWNEEWTALVLAGLRPGAFLFAFGGTRTYHRLACAIEDAGFEIRDAFAWLYGCLSEDTEILVDGGWVHYRSATTGRLALCYDVEHDEYAWRPIEREFVYDYDDVAYRVLSERTDQIVTRGHRVVVRDGDGWTFRVAEEVALESEASVPVLEDVHRLFREFSVSEPDASDSQQVLRGVRAGADAGAEAPETDGATPRDGMVQLRRLRRGSVAPGIQASEDEAAGLLAVMQRAPACGGTCEALAPRAQRVDAGELRVVPREDDRIAEPGVEGRRHVQAVEGELRRPKVRPVPAGTRVDGSNGRLRHGASACRCASDWEAAVADGGRPPCRSRHAEQRAQEPDAVRHEPGPQTVRGERFTTASLARLIPFRLKGKVWCVKVPTGAFVARRNGKVFVTGNSGFPKSLDISRQVDALDAVGPRRDRALRFTAWMRTTGVTAAQVNAATDSFMASHFFTDKEQPEIPTPEMFDKIRPLLSAPVPEEIEELIRSRQVESENVKRRPVVSERIGADLLNSRPVSIAAQGIEATGRRMIQTTAAFTPLAQRWSGYGTALKPGYEPCVVAMKPLDGTFAANAMKHGVAGLNIDGSRIACAGGSPAAERRETMDAPRNRPDGPIQNRVTAERFKEAREGETIGRWPANVVLSHSAACELGLCSPDCPAFVLDAQSGHLTSGTMKAGTARSARSARSVCYGAMPDTATLTDTPGDEGGASRFFYCAKADTDERHGSRHPTLKPMDLCAYLARMLLPPPRLPGEPPRRILVPFAGAGSEVVGCLRAGWDEVVAVEMDPAFAADIRRRVEREFALLVKIEEEK